MSIGTRIRTQRAALSLSQADLAQAVGVRQQTIGDLERGKSRGTKHLIALARALNVTPEWLESGKGPKEIAPAPSEAPITVVAGGMRQKRLGREGAVVEVGGESYAAIPRYDMQASAGHGREAPGTAVVLHHHLFRLQWLRRVTSAPVAKLFALEVNGDSMEVTLRSGDIVLVDQTQNQPSRKDGMYVLNQDGELKVKRVSAHPVTGRLTIRSDNPAYEPFADIDPDDIIVVGRVVWIGRQV